MPENIINNNEHIISSEPSINILSHEVQEIISHKPKWIVRNGILLFLLILASLIGITFFISYPDIITATTKITSLNSPKEVKSKTEGRLIRLNAIEGKFVQKGQLLGFMESRANHYEVIMLSQIIDTLQKIVQANNTEKIPVYLVQDYQNLGEVQQPYQTFMQGFLLFKQYLSSGYYLKKKEMLQNDIGYLQRLHINLLQQENMMAEDASLAKETFDANSSLKKDKVISSLDYRNEKSKYIGKSISLPQIAASIITNESNQHEKQKEILQLENEIEQQKENFSEILNTFKVQLDEWKNKFLLIAPVDGKIAFANFFQENQQMQNNQTICFINPENTQYYAEVYITQNNFGKIKQGQTVLLKLPSYPFQEFGTITGKLEFISIIATDSGYLARVILPDGLLTNYKKKLQYHEGLLAESQIITNNTKLSDRLFYQFQSLIKKN